MPDKNPPRPAVSCGRTVKDHTEQAFFGLRIAGLGLGCPEVYKALRELTAFAEQQFGHDASYQPQGLMNDALTDKVAPAAEAAQLVLEQAAFQMAVTQMLGKPGLDGPKTPKGH